jgi:hypothetical protein
MSEPISSLLGPWSGFYAVVGSSAAALTGLMFVVITLVKDRERATSSDGISTFSTPTVMHFGTALLLSALLIVPWRALLGLEILVGLIGAYGVVNILGAARRTKRLRIYTADIEDWVWYSIFPLVAYGAILAGAIALHAFSATALFVVAAGVLLLVFIGIRNAWDVVTYLAAGGGAG